MLIALTSFSIIISINPGIIIVDTPFLLFLINLNKRNKRVI